MSDRDELVELLALYATIPDTRSWDDLPRRVFTDEVTFDFESVTGRPAMTVSPEQFAAMLAPVFRQYAATHHAITNHLVTIDGDTARIRAHIKAEHWIPPALANGGPSCWMLVGFYDDEAVRTTAGWRLSRVKLSITYEEHPEVRTLAGQAAAAAS